MKKNGEARRERERERERGFAMRIGLCDYGN
jgi:hypothetical protein